MKYQTLGQNGRLSKIPQLQPKPLVGSFLVRHRTDEEFYLSIVISGIHPFYDHQLRYPVPSDSATNELLSALRTETLRLTTLRFGISSLLIESSFRDFFVHDLLRRNFATPDLAPRTRLNPHLYFNSISTQTTTRKDLGVLEDISTNNRKGWPLPFCEIGLISSLP